MVGTAYSLRADIRDATVGDERLVGGAFDTDTSPVGEGRRDCRLGGSASPSRSPSDSVDRAPAHSSLCPGRRVWLDGRVLFRSRDDRTGTHTADDRSHGGWSRGSGGSVSYRWRALPNGFSLSGLPPYPTTRPRQVVECSRRSPVELWTNTGHRAVLRSTWPADWRPHRSAVVMATRAEICD